MKPRHFWLPVLGGLALVTLVVGWGVNRYLIEQRMEAAGERLALLGTLRREALERYLDTAEAELSFWSTNEYLRGQQAWIVSAWERGIPAGSDPAVSLRQRYIEGKPFPGGRSSRNARIYSALHDRLHAMAELFVSERGYYDFFLISPEGDVHYTVLKEDDYATNLVTGPYKDTGLAEVFRQVMAAPDSGAVKVSDLEAYAPSGGVPAMFLARAMFDENEQLIGVIALQVPTGQLHSIMQFDAGMGETGETYLVGQDYLMRSESRFTNESTVLRRRVDSETAQRALRGEMGVDFALDYRDVEVLSAYSSMPVGETSWAVMAEMDKSEILEQATSQRPVIAGFMLFFYSLGIWSAWFIQRAQSDGDSGHGLADLDMDFSGDFGDG